MRASNRSHWQHNDNVGFHLKFAATLSNQWGPLVSEPLLFSERSPSVLAEAAFLRSAKSSCMANRPELAAISFADLVFTGAFLGFATVLIGGFFGCGLGFILASMGLSCGGGGISTLGISFTSRAGSSLLGSSGCGNGKNAKRNDRKITQTIDQRRSLLNAPAYRLGPSRVSHADNMMRQLLQTYHESSWVSFCITDNEILENPAKSAHRRITRSSTL